MSEIKFNPIPEKSAGDRPARSDERKPANESASKLPSNDEYYSPLDIGGVSDEAKNRIKNEIDPK